MNKERAECEASIKNKRYEDDDFNTQTRCYKHANSTQKHNKNLKI